MTSARDDSRWVRTRRNCEKAGTVSRTAVVTTPVSPIPPAVAQKPGSEAESRRASPVAVHQLQRAGPLPERAVRWWFFPCTSAAMAPPT